MCLSGSRLSEGSTARKKKYVPSFHQVHGLCCVTNIFTQHVQYTSENMEPMGLQFSVL